MGQMCHCSPFMGVALFSGSCHFSTSWNQYNEMDSHCCDRGWRDQSPPKAQVKDWGRKRVKIVMQRKWECLSNLTILNIWTSTYCRHGLESQPHWGDLFRMCFWYILLWHTLDFHASLVENVWLAVKCHKSETGVFICEGEYFAEVFSKILPCSGQECEDRDSGEWISREATHFLTVKLRFNR